MKVLAIMGSPKGKGSGYKVTKKIEGKMKELGAVEFEYLLLKDAQLELCRGCFTCISKGEDLCSLKDDGAKIEEQIENSYGVILVSPGYVQNVSWLIKNFIDRFAYTYHRPRFFNQKVMLIVNGGVGLKKTLKTLRITFGGPKVVHELAYMSPPGNCLIKLSENSKRQSMKHLENSSMRSAQRRVILRASGISCSSDSSRTR